MVAFLLIARAHAVAPTQPGDVTLTEFQADTMAVAPEYGEWLELRNSSGGTLDINGVTLTLASGQTLTITDAPLLGVDDLVVLGASDDVAVNGGVIVDIVYDYAAFDLSASEDGVTIRHGVTVLDAVAWDASWGAGLDRSASCIEAAWASEWANDHAENWCAASTSYGDEWGTPGEQNDACDGDDVDDDGDGWTENDGDCDDDDPEVNPGEIDGSAAPFGVADDDADCDGVRDQADHDDDGDGVSEIDGDCDDDQPATYPGAAERGDGADNDCNGCIDDTDADGDGWTTCPDGDGRYDCDDLNAGVHPDAAEVPVDGIDQDCDGLEDDCESDGEGTDADGDGYWVYPEAWEECADLDYGAGWDCNDADPAVHPDAPDRDGDGVDSNCDGCDDVCYDHDHPLHESDTADECGCASTRHGTALWALALAVIAASRRKSRAGSGCYYYHSQNSRYYT